MINRKEFDLIVIGGGPGGYVAAIRASQLGFSVLCIEKRKSLGGTCLNVGCIPSKTLLHSSHLYNLSKNHFKKLGIKVNGEINLDLDKMMSNKEEIVGKLTGGINSLFKKNKVTFLQGSAKIIGSNLVEIENSTFQAKTILISTGSVPSEIKNIEVYWSIRFYRSSKKTSCYRGWIHWIGTRFCLEKARIRSYSDRIFSKYCSYYGCRYCRNIF